MSVHLSAILGLLLVSLLSFPIGANFRWGKHYILDKLDSPTMMQAKLALQCSSSPRVKWENGYDITILPPPLDRRDLPIDRRDEGQSLITPLTRSGGGFWIGNFLDLDPHMQ